MAPTNAKLKIVEGKISDTMDHIEALKLQVEQAEIQMQRLQEEKAAILETFADHRRVFTPFRKLPEDVLREISVACVQSSGIPELSSQSNDPTPMPYLLGQVCRGLRHVAWTTPSIWASIHVGIWEGDSKLAPWAKEWLDRAGGLALTLKIQLHGDGSDPCSMLFDVLLSFSTRWREIDITSWSSDIPPSMIRIAALTAADLPLLQSISLCFHGFRSNIVLNDSELLKLPTLRHVSLDKASRVFTVNWPILTSITLSLRNTSSDIGRILQKTPYLEFCDIIVSFSAERHAHEISLPCLKNLKVVTKGTRYPDPSGAHSILEAITAPILEILETCSEFFDLSLPKFVKKSPHICKLSFSYHSGDNSQSLTERMEFLRHCPSLRVLSIRIYDSRWGIPEGDQFLRTFVEEGNEGIFCPRLQEFKLTGQLIFSIETLRIFLEGKQGDIHIPNVLPWRRVFISKHRTVDPRFVVKNRQLLDLVARKRAEGLDVHVYM